MQLDAFLAAGEGVPPAESAARAPPRCSPTTSRISFSRQAPPDTPRVHRRRMPSRCGPSGRGPRSSGSRSVDRYLVVNPFFHTFGYKAGILACLMAGATVVPEAVFDPSAVMARIGAERISVLPGPPTLYQTLLADPPRPSTTCRRCGWGSPARPWSRSSWSRRMRDELGFDTVLTAYGLTESCGTVTMCRRERPARDRRRDLGPGHSGAGGPGGGRQEPMPRRVSPARSWCGATP